MKRSAFQDKKEIQRRIQRMAAELWNLKDKNLQAIDPVVSFIIGAISEELAKLGNEISEIRHGLVDEISSSLLPRELIGAKPAHAVIHAMPNDVDVIIDRRHQFVTKVEADKSSQSHSSGPRDIFLSSVADFHLSRSRVDRIITPKGMIEWNGNTFEPNENANIQTEDNNILLGISLDEEIDHIENIELFFYHENPGNIENVIDEIDVLQASIGQYIPSFGRKPRRFLSNENAIRSFITISHMQEQEVLDLYGPFYGEVELKLNVRNWKEKSALFIQSKYVEEADKLNLQHFLWLQLSSSNPHAAEIMNGLRCQTNCFPVINRKYNEFPYRTNGYYNILNLPGSDEFYDIEEIHSINGQQYHSTNLVQAAEEDSFGYYEIRNHRTGRIDENEVVNKLNYLVDLLRDESSAFAAMDYNFLDIHLRTLNQNIELLKNKIPKSHTPTGNTYLILNCKEAIDTVFIKYWTTEGMLANKVLAGSEIQPLDNYDIVDDSISLISTPSLGRDRLSPVERLRKLQWQLSSKDSIYSREDIRKFCLSKSMGVADVEIDYSLKMHPEAHKGMEKIISVVLIPHSKQPMGMDDKETIRLEIEKGIEYKSLLAFPTEVKWKN